MLTIRTFRHINSRTMQKTQKGIKNPYLVAVAVIILLGIIYVILQVAYGAIVESFVPERMIEQSTLPLPYKWSYTAATKIHGHPVAVAGLILLRTDDSVIALKTETGERSWIVPAPAFASLSPDIAIQGNVLLVVSDRGSKVLAFDVRDGTVLWSQEPFGSLGKISTVATDNQRTYVGLVRAGVPIRAYDLQSGEPIWDNDLLVPSGYSVAAMEINNNELYAVVGNDLFILDSRTGTLKKTITGFYQGNNIQLVNHVALTWFNSTLLVKDVESGNRIWQFNKRPHFFNVIGDRVYVSSNCCALHALQLSTGQLLWERPLPLLTGSEVVTIGNTGYVMMEDGSILAFDTESGADRGKLETTPHSVGINVPDRGLGTDGTSLYATFGDNKVFAFGP